MNYKWEISKDSTLLDKKIKQEKKKGAQLGHRFKKEETISRLEDQITPKDIMENQREMFSNKDGKSLIKF